MRDKNKYASGGKGSIRPEITTGRNGGENEAPNYFRIKIDSVRASRKFRIPLQNCNSMIRTERVTMKPNVKPRY
jgi:hypothetical protein